MSEMISVPYDTFTSIIIDLVGLDCRSVYKSYADAFNRSPESSKYGSAICTLAGYGSTYEFGSPIFNIEFANSKMKTVFLLKFGQYLK